MTEIPNFTKINVKISLPFHRRMGALWGEFVVVVAGGGDDGQEIGAFVPNSQWETELWPHSRLK